MSGCSLVFGEEYRAIVGAVQSGTVVARETADVERWKLDQEDSAPPHHTDVLERSLSCMKRDLTSDRHDVRLLALEVVASTTNSDGGCGDTAVSASKMIMGDAASGIRDSVASILLTGKEDADVFDDGYVRSLALTIFSNVLSTLSKEKLLSPFVRDEWYTSSLIPVLVDEIKTAAKHPCNASLAAKCLSALFANSREACCRGPKDVLVSLEAAKKVGKASYANLEKEAQIAIEEMVQREN